jgi:hypothetical protein
VMMRKWMDIIKEALSSNDEDPRDLTLIHKTPCAECPWRKDSLKGYLGGNTPEMYADSVQNGEAPACHMRDETHPKGGAFCVGALQCMANSATLPKDPEPRAAREIVGRSDKVFNFPALFYKYHTGKDYVPFWQRMMDRRNK